MNGKLSPVDALFLAALLGPNTAAAGAPRGNPKESFAEILKEVTMQAMGDKLATLPFDKVPEEQVTEVKALIKRLQELDPNAVDAILVQVRYKVQASEPGTECPGCGKVHEDGHMGLAQAAIGLNGTLKLLHQMQAVLIS